ncbi:alpha/beta fold hydrolase [Mycobacterium marinum]|uniref:alpha/beta fold hydrolase n=1 Tax=Mycobacterium marinum TaxID=1781 RepID=UPI0009DB8B8A|nr:alpha/beta hydrolase [Mycobacterium marinum]
MGRYVENLGVRIWTQSFGSRAGKAILLISGAMAPAIFWNSNFCERLADLGYFVLRFDSRDIGDSTHFPPARDADTDPPYTIDELVDDVRAILADHDLNTVVLIGHSLGSTVAQLFAVKYPERVEKLFLMSSPIIATGNNIYAETDSETLAAMWQVLMSNKMYPDYKRGKEEFFKVWRHLNGSFELDTDLADEYTKRLYETEVIEPAYNHTKVQVGIDDTWTELSELEIPIHFIYGEKDQLASNVGNIQILANSLPNAHLTVLKGAGHMYFHRRIWQQILSVLTEALA